MGDAIVINAKWRRASSFSGVQRYASDLTEALADGGLDFREITPRVSGARLGTFWEQILLPRCLRPGDTLFCPANMAPLTMPRRVRLVVTLHCLRYLNCPKSYSRQFRAWYRFAIPRILDRADAVIAVSRSAADEIRERFPGTGGKLVVCEPGIHQRFRPSVPSTDPGITRSRVDRQDRAGTEPYWVFLGNATEAKNLPLALKAVARARTGRNLVVAGAGAADLERVLHPDWALQDCNVEPLGAIRDPERIASLLRGASGLLAPSRYESFGFPVVEAMASGVPVLASDIPAHREVGGDAAIYLPHRNPDEDAEAWARAIDDLESSPGERRVRARLGIERASHYNWSRAASGVAGVLRAV